VSNGNKRPSIESTTYDRKFELVVTTIAILIRSRSVIRPTIWRSPDTRGTARRCAYPNPSQKYPKYPRSRPRWQRTIRWNAHSAGSCRNGGTISVAGVYGGLVDKLPIGSFMNRGLTMRTGQTHVQRYWDELLQRTERDEIDPSFVISHRMPLEDTPDGYKLFRDKQDDCMKVVLLP
jgi:hypothetical protein